MNSRAANLTGQRFGRLVVGVLLRTDPKTGRVWTCVCDCGNVCEKTTGKLRDKHNPNVSCGCAVVDSIAKASAAAWKVTTKFSHPHKIKLKWLRRGMIGRCYEPKFRRYERYGGRGITVCNDWRDNPTTFYEWAVANGYDPSLSIERVDRNGNYCPENCRFATRIEQANNTSRNHFITHDQRTQTIAQWEREKGLPRGFFQKRFSRGMSAEGAFAECS